MDIDNFYNVVVPSILLEMRRDYYVKGGRCFNAYFKLGNRSRDWDIVLTKEKYEFMKAQLDKFASENNLKILVKNSVTYVYNNLTDEENPFSDPIKHNVPLNQIGFDGIDDNGDPWLIDLVILEKSDIMDPPPIKLDGINYMFFSEFVIDLIGTFERRAFHLDLYYKSGRKILSSLIEFNKKISKFKIQLSYRGIQTDAHMIRYLIETLENLLLKNSDNIKNKLDLHIRGIINELSEIEEIEEIKNIDAYFTSQLSKKEIEINQLVNYMLEDFVVEFESLSINPHILLLLSKYDKTNSRVDTVLNMTWDSLTLPFQQYLRTRCEENEDGNFILPLFEISPTCLSFVECDGKNIYTRRNCISAKKLDRHQSIRRGL